MANLHGMDDQLPYQQPNRNRQNRFNLGPNQSRIPFLTTPASRSPPRKESYVEMLHLLLCPRYSMISLTTLLLAINAGVFCICIYDGIQPEGTLLQIQDDSLKQRGALIPSQIKNDYAYQQVLTSIFLSFDFMQYIFNSVLILILGSNIEYATGPFIFAILYFAGGMIGALFGTFINCCTDSHYLHTSSAIFALIGSLIGFYILNWESLTSLEDMRCCILCIFTMISLIFLLQAFQPHQDARRIDKFGCLGGYMAGLFLCLAVAKPVKREQFEMKAQLFGCTFTAILVFVSIIMIYVS